MARNVFVEKQQLQGAPSLALTMAYLYLEVVKGGRREGGVDGWKRARKLLSWRQAKSICIGVFEMGLLYLHGSLQESNPFWVCAALPRRIPPSAFGSSQI
jgi:hypothetical protein